MAAMADGCYDALTPAQQRAARRILLHLAGEENGVDVRRRVPLATLGVDDDADTRVALDALVARRLVIVDQSVAEVAHEALLRDWPRLARWLDEDRTGRRLHQQLAVAAIAWNDGGRDRSELYRGTRLQGAVDWAEDHDDDLAPFEREFLDASRADAVRELEQARTRARVETRRSRRLRFSLVGIVLLLVIALIAGGLALRSRDEADATALRADANRLAGLGATGHDLDGALMDAVEGVRLDDNGETRAGLLAALQRAPRALRVTHARTGTRPQSRAPRSLGVATRGREQSPDRRRLRRARLSGCRVRSHLCRPRRSSRTDGWPARGGCPERLTTRPRASGGWWCVMCVNPSGGSSSSEVSELP